MAERERPQPEQLNVGETVYFVDRKVPLPKEPLIVQAGRFLGRSRSQESYVDLDVVTDEGWKISMSKPQNEVFNEEEVRKVMGEDPYLRYVADGRGLAVDDVIDDPVTNRGLAAALGKVVFERTADDYLKKLRTES